MKRLCQSVSEHDSLNGSGLGARISSCSNSCCEYDSIGTVSVFIVTVILRSITLMAGNIIIWSGNSFSTMRLTNKLTEFINPVADPRFPIQSSFYRPQRSCGKVMFSQASVTLGQTRPGQKPPPTATAADGTHPTGMHSCFHNSRLIR